MLRQRSFIIILVFLYRFFPSNAGLKAFAQQSDDPAAQLPSVQESAAAGSGVSPAAGLKSLPVFDGRPV